MKRTRHLLGVFLAAALTFPVIAAAAGKTVPPSAPWPQAESDIAPDPAVRFGTLPNGMRYAIFANRTPPGQVSLRLRIDAGALQENAGQQGLAHFLEHIAFRGSHHIPDGEAFRLLQRYGAAPGADSNAFTDMTQTVFKVDLPVNGAEAVETALMFLRETAAEELIEEAAVESERSVVLAEERARDAPLTRLHKAEMAFLFKDQPLGSHLPIGEVALLQKARAADLRAFYDAYYRPERATLIVAGDVAPDKLAAKIKARFGDWRGRGKPGADPRLGPPEPRSQEVKIVTEAGAPTSLAIEWTQPPDGRPDNKARERDGLLRQLGLMILDRRLRDMAHGVTPPFLAARAFHHQLAHSAQLTAIALASSEEGWKVALTAGLRAERGLLREGVRQDELERQIGEWRAALEAAVAGAATRKSSALADELVHAVDAGDVFVTPAADLALFQEIVAGVTREQVDQALAGSFAGNGPLFFLAGPQPMEGVQAVLAEAEGEAGPAGETAPAPVPWPYGAFGPAGMVVERREEADLGLTMVRFANGVRLTVKPTQFRADQILIAVSLGHGRQDLPIDRPTPLWAAEGGALIGGGLAALSLPELERCLAGKQTNLHFEVNDNGFLLSSATRPQDFDVALQLLTASLTAPGWRPEGFEAVRKRLIAALRQWQASPAGVLQRNIGVLLHGDDPRWLAPDAAALQSARLEELRALLDPVLARAPIEAVVVGDVTSDQAIAALATTLGALPDRAPESPAPEAGRRVRLPEGGKPPRLLRHKGRADQGLALSFWPSADLFGDLSLPRHVRLLQQVLQQRLTDEFRTRLGSSYSPGSDIQASGDYPGYGLLLAWAETPPDKMAIFDETLEKIAADLREGEVSADEFERARKPRVETLLKSQQTNEYWLTSLLRAQSDPKALAVVRSLIPDLRAATAADLRRAANLYLQEDRLWRLRILPETAEP